MRYHDPLLESDPLERGPDVLWMRAVDRQNRAQHIQSHYKIYKNEMKDPNEANHSHRETAMARRGRLENLAFSK